MESPRHRLAQLLWRVSEAAFTDWTGHLTRTAQQYGLAMSELNVLYELSMVGPLNVSQIAQRTGLSKAAASQMIQRMVVEGLLERRESPHSRREKQVSLTPKAQAVNRQFDQAILEELAQVFEPVPEKLLTKLGGALEDVLEHLPRRDP